MPENTFADIHSHSVMTHYRNQRSGIPVCKEINKGVKSFIEFIMGKEAIRSYNTQADLGKLAINNVNTVVISLYPIERKWFMPKTPKFVVNRISLISNITGFSKENVKDLDNEEPVNYFADLIGEYNYLKQQMGTQCSGKNFKIVKDYDELEASVQSGDTISFIISIEGAASIASNLPGDSLEKRPEKITLNDYNQYYRDNVFKLKSLGPDNDGTHCPFFIGLSHHFWNLLCGHCESLPFIFNQRVGKESKITTAGWKMIEDFLSTNDINGVPGKYRRILIDVKHMSPLARKEYYEYLRRNNFNVPIIFSHAAVGDAPSLDSFIKKTDDYRMFKKPKNYFNTSTLSLNDEDIQEVIKTNGIIGIVLHEGRIAAKRAMKKRAYGVKNNKRKYEYLNIEIGRLETKHRRARRRKRKERLLKRITDRKHERKDAIKNIKNAYLCMIMANIYRVVETTFKMNNNLKGKGWDHVCIGSDYDGMINKLDFLGTVNEFPEFKNMFIEHLKNPEPLLGFDPAWTTNKLKELQFGMTPEILADKFFSDNAKEFLRKFFNEDYLLSHVGT